MNLECVAREAGLHPLVCPHCGKKVRTIKAIDLMFRVIVNRLRLGDVVKIRFFGSFERRLHKARGITKAAGDRYYIGFDPVPNAKKAVNGESHHD